jgi:ariadne-1
LDKELYERTERQMEEMQKSSEFSWIQVQFLKGAVQVLLQSRQTLMWTYCLGYYLARKVNSTFIFEDNQKDLEMAVEALSGLLETVITQENAGEVRKNVLDKTEYVNRRREVLLSDAAIGHQEGRWEYTM